MQASAAGADQAVRLDDLFDTEKMAWKRTAIGCARFGNTFARRGIGLVLSLDGRDGRFQILQRQIDQQADRAPSLIAPAAKTGSFYNISYFSSR